MPSQHVLQSIFSIALGDVRSGLIRLEMLWTGKRSWPTSLEDTDSTLGGMDHHKNTFEKVKMLCAANDMDNFTERAYNLIESNDFTVRVLHENVMKILEARGIANDMDALSKTMDLISDSQTTLAISRDTRYTTITGCIHPMHSILHNTENKSPIFPKMPTLLNAAKQESENKNPLKYMVAGDTITQYAHTGYSFKTQNITGPIELFQSAGLELSMVDWVHHRYVPGEKDKKVVLPRDIHMCLNQLNRGDVKRSKRKAVNVLEPFIQDYLKKETSL